MKIDHLAIYTPDLERAKTFYCHYFGFSAGAKYTNPAKQFESYFLHAEGDARLELMTRPGLVNADNTHRAGYAHIALSVGGEAEVISLTGQLVNDGYPLLSGPRWTGDGYFESAIQDPDGNTVEITA
ncbi:MAG TPA: VOC family protein [Cellvibrio sp.]